MSLGLFSPVSLLGQGESKGNSIVIEGVSKFSYLEALIIQAIKCLDPH